MILCTGGMSVDPDDSTPGAIKASGADIVTYGAPVLPGAMFLLGYYGDGRPVMGLPGCVMYAKATIFDLVLPRIAADVWRPGAILLRLRRRTVSRLRKLYLSALRLREVSTVVSAKVITVSDRSFCGERGFERPCGQGAARARRLRGGEVEVRAGRAARIESALIHAADEENIALIITTGGTGFAPRDVTPEATIKVCEKLAPGIPEAMRAASMRITPKACLSRAAAGIRGKSLIVNLPGSPKGACENLQAVLEPLEHGIYIPQGGKE